MRHYLRCFCIFMVATALLGLAAPDVRAQEDGKEAMKADKTGTNPINFTFDARLYNEYQWLNTDGDGHQNITTFEFRMPFADGKWQFRSKMRAVDLEADFNDDGIDDVNEFGLGDMDIRFMTVPYLSKKGGVAVGVEFFLDTASEDALGAGAWTMAPLVFLPIFNPIGKGSILVPGYQHKISLDENDGRSQVHQGLIDLFLVKTFGGNQFWGFIDPQILLDYENDIQFMLLELQAGMMLDRYFGIKGHSAYVMPSIGVGHDRPYDGRHNVGVAVGVEFFLDTASEDALGAGAWTMAPLVFLPIFNPIGKGSILVPGYQHKISLDENDGRSQVHQGLIDLFLVKTFGGNQFWGFIDPQILLDYENDIQFMLLELQAGMMLDRYFGIKGHSAYVMPSIGVGHDRPYDFSLEVGYKIVW